VVVRSSKTTTNDPNRKAITTGGLRWVKEVAGSQDGGNHGERMIRTQETEVTVSADQGRARRVRPGPRSFSLRVGGNRRRPVLWTAYSPLSSEKDPCSFYAGVWCVGGAEPA